jgi:Carbohydrate family 9 binding domain-like
MKYLLILFVLLSSLVFAQEATAVKRSINIGGDLSQWDALTQYPIELSNAAEPQAVTQKGYFSVAWDDTNVYFLGVFDQPKDTLTATLTSDAEEWWNEDTMEIFLRLPTNPEMLHYASSPLGSRFSNLLASSNYFTSSRLEDTRWILEMAFPLGMTELPVVQSGDSWELKVGRGNVAASEYSLWPVGKDFLAEDNFGTLVFAE